VSEAWTRVPELAAQHLLLAITALVLGIAIAVPLGFWSAHRPAAARSGWRRTGRKGRRIKR
jgi:osmoprotectant transport system permease protein